MATEEMEGTLLVSTHGSSLRLAWRSASTSTSSSRHGSTWRSGPCWFWRGTSSSCPHPSTRRTAIRASPVYGA
eukprot:1193981-Alexandrium_andersonii.AAC.1